MLPHSKKLAKASCKDGFWNSVNGIWAMRSEKSLTMAPSLASTSAEGGEVSNASNSTTPALALLIFCQWDSRTLFSLPPQSLPDVAPQDKGRILFTDMEKDRLIVFNASEHLNK